MLNACHCHRPIFLTLHISQLGVNIYKTDLEKIETQSYDHLKFFKKYFMYKRSKVIYNFLFFNCVFKIKFSYHEILITNLYGYKNKRYTLHISSHLRWVVIN